MYNSFTIAKSDSSANASMLGEIGRVEGFDLLFLRKLTQVLRAIR
ncbi:hypothetical protein BRDCF_p1696 [Bacteroidales bacterium CF]|nr:hypothetical protein BRDCF_p1696 [Bacteroidales bacterium CF]